MKIGDLYVRCKFCSSDFTVTHGGKNDVAQISSKRHKDVGKAVSISKSVKTLFRLNSSNITINGRPLWATFIAKHI